LKARKTGKPVPDLHALTPGTTAAAAAAGAAAKASKRYLILTYVVEFDRVHYPLPLTQQDGPSVATLQRQVGELAGGGGRCFVGWDLLPFACVASCQIRRLRREVASFRVLSGLPETSASLTASGLPGTAQAALVASVNGMQREIEVLRERSRELAVSVFECARTVRPRLSSLVCLAGADVGALPARVTEGRASTAEGSAGALTGQCRNCVDFGVRMLLRPRAVMASA